jgi:phosphatidylinositol glycan class S
MAPRTDVGEGNGDHKPKPLVQSSNKPPAETLEGIRVRGLVIVSFWAVVVFLGLPVWLWTTSIHRARLPLREMLDWADGKVRVLNNLLHYH